MNIDTGSVLNAFLLIFLATFVPTAFFSALNQKYFTTKQIRNSLLIAFAAAVLSGFIAAVLHAYTASTNLAAMSAGIGVNAADLLCALLAILIYSILGERFFSDLNISRTLRRGILVTASAILVAVSAIYSLVPFTVLLFFMLTSAVVDGYRQRNVERHILIGDNASSTNSEAALTKNGITLKQKPNIHLLLLESYHSSEAARELYGIDDSETIQKLQELEYTIHENTFSNVHGTMLSLATLLSGSLAADQDKSSFILDVLRENGYSCGFFSTSPYIFCNHARPGDFVSFSLPPSVAKLYAFAGPLVSQSKYLRLFARGIDIFPEEISFESCFSAFQQEILRGKQQPKFNLMHFGAGHFIEGRDIDKFKQTYVELYKNAEMQLRQVTQFLAKHDPEAIVIAIGDHGGMQYLAECNSGPRLQEELRRLNISNTSFALDMFSVLLAVRSHIPQILGTEIVSHVNVFRKVFAALGGGENLLDDLEPNISSVRGNIVVNEGNVLNPFKLGNGAFASVRSIARRHEKGTALPSELLLLASMEKHRNPVKAIRLLKDALQKDPEQAPALCELGRIHLLLSDSRSCAYLKKAWKLAPHDQKIAAMYYFSLLLHAPLEKAEDFFASQKLLSNTEAVQIKANYLRTNNLGSQSLEFILQASLAAPDNARTRLLLAWEYYDLRLYQKAEKEIQLILNGSQQHAGMESLMNNTSGQASQLQFFIRSALGNASGVEELFKGNMDSTVHRWRFIPLSAAFEKQGKINDALCCILDNMNVSVVSELTLRIGYLALRHGISEPAFKPLTESALSLLTDRVRRIEACGIFDAAWYAATNMKKGDTEKPLVHYLTHGVYHGLNPTPWFGTARFIINDFWAWWHGANPLLAFVDQGVKPEHRSLLALDPLIAVSAYEQQPTLNPRWMEALVAYYKTKETSSQRAA